MIVTYDRNPALSTEQKLESLINSMQLALNELYDRQHEMEKKIAELKAALEAANN